MRKVFILLVLILSFQKSSGYTSEPARLLQGQIAGVRVSSLGGGPGDPLRVDVRGLNTLRANTSPLWIVDGAVLSNAPAQVIQPFLQYCDYGYLPMYNPLSGIDANDIESIEVLNNTSATALYGTKGANGVIIVKTRRPEGEKLQVDVNSNVGISISEIIAEGISPAVRHNHNIAIGSVGKSSYFRLSAFLSDEDGVYKGNGNTYFGLRTSFGANKSDAISFGGTLALYSNEIDAPATASWYGSSSMTLASRKIAPMNGNATSSVNSVDGWIKDYDNISDNFRTTDNVYFNLKLFPGFIWKNNVSFDFQQNTRNIWYGNGTAFGYQYNGAASVSNSSLLSINASSAFSFSRYINAVNNISADLTLEFMSQQNKYNTMTGTDFFSHDLRSKALSLMESTAVVRHYATSFSNPAAGLNLHYDYKDLAGLDLQARYDTYLQYDLGTEFMDNFFPSAYAYVDLRNLLIRDNPVLSMFRIEGGYGISGLRQVMPYASFSMYSNGGYPQVQADEQANYKGMNRILSDEYHVTVKAGLKDDMFVLGATYYDRSINDGMSIYHIKEEKPVTAYSSTFCNRGAELEADIFAIRNSKSEFEINLTAAYNFNRVTKVDSADMNGLPLNSYGISATVNKEGYPVSSIYGYTLDSENVVNGVGVLGNTIPIVTGGINLSYRLMGLEVCAVADWAVGHNILNMNRMLASGQEFVSAAFVEKGDYFRLADLSASYNFKFNCDWIRSLRVSLSAGNLLTASAYSGWNPDVNSFGYTNMANGIDYGSYPIIRTIMLGLNVKF